MITNKIKFLNTVHYLFYKYIIHSYEKAKRLFLEKIGKGSTCSSMSEKEFITIRHKIEWDDEYDVNTSTYMDKELLSKEDILHIIATEEYWDLVIKYFPKDVPHPESLYKFLKRENNLFL